MTFKHRDYLNQYLKDYKEGKFTNDSPAAKVIRFLNVGPHYRIIGVHHLTGEENKGKHNLYLDCVDESGNRRSERIQWGWEGQKPTEIVTPVILDKPITEPAGNISIHAGQKVWAQVFGQETDRVENVHTLLGNENAWNSNGHHSHYVVFMYVSSIVPSPEPSEPPSEECEDELQKVQQKIDEAIVLMEAALAKLEG